MARKIGFEYSVYKHTTPSGKVYIGITSVGVKKRWMSGYGYRKNRYFFSAIKKYGWDSIIHEVLFTDLTKEQAIEMEIRLISEYNSNNPKFGYNLTVGGEGLNTHVFTDEHRKKISDSRKGKSLSEEVKKKISVTKMGSIGTPHTDEGRRKISEAQKGVSKPKLAGKNHYQAKPIRCVTTGEIYDTITQASDVCGIPPSCISRCCNGERQSAGKLNGVKLKWEFVEEREDG